MEHEGADECAVSPLRTLTNSPVQEQHIDFLLEEEFACNSKFLHFFIVAAQEHFTPIPNETYAPELFQPCDKGRCEVTRSVTTEDGETDVLVIYRSAAESKKIAILIENKIRAAFQPGQPARYLDRGKIGKAQNQWNDFWTCLLAPEKYASNNSGFHPRITLEKLAELFREDNERSHFKANVIRRAIKKIEETGLQIESPEITRFRAFYAAQAASFFTEGEINWPQPRKAWHGDTWFNFRGGGIPHGAEIVYKAPRGFVDLAFSNTKSAWLDDVLTRCEHSGIRAEQTSKSAAFRMEVSPIVDFTNTDAARPIVMASLQRVRDLVAFYKANSTLIESALRSASSTDRPEVDQPLG